MRRSLHLFAVAGAFGIWAMPAHAAGGLAAGQAAVQLPDPDNISLFALGLAGLIIGRWFMGKKPHD